MRSHSTVCHSQTKWSRANDGDGIREVPANTIEAPWIDVRNFLQPFKAVYKNHLSGYVTIAEFKSNLKRISPSFIYAITKAHFFYT